MKALKILLSFSLLGILFACGDSGNDDAKSIEDQALKESTGMTSDEIQQEAVKVAVTQKYPIKSGIITFERKGVIGNQKIIVYFDEFGTKERNETYNEDGSVEEITFSDGENMFKIRNPAESEKIAYIMGPGLYGTEMKFEPDPFKDNEKRREKYQFKKLENMNILGKECEVYSMTTGGNVTTFGGWSNLHLYSKVDMSIGITETIAVDLKENVSVDPNLFKVPEGYITQ